MIEAFRRDIEGILPFNTSAIFIFEAAPFRPGDEHYRVQGVTADGDALKLRIDTPDDRETTLVVVGPDGVTTKRPGAGSQAIRIERAARVEWRLPFGTYSAQTRGDDVEIRTAALAPDAPAFIRSLTTALVIE